MRTDAPRDDKVSIVQGSGSGHEPAHVMAVGRGMLDAACPGDVFAAPPSDYVYETTKLMASPKGVLHIINNYTGDRMSFDMGRELAEAEDIKIATIIVDDDVAVKDSTYTVGRRGVAGNFFVIKAVGAAHCIMSTDAGQWLNPPAAQQMGIYIKEALKSGIKAADVRLMVSDNPAKILGI